MAANGVDIYGEMREEINRSDPSKLMKTIGIGMMSGIVVFLGVVIFIYFTQDQDIASSPDIVFYLSVTNLVFFIVSYFARDIVVQNTYKKNKPYTSAKGLIETIQSATIIKYALMEGPGFFGCVALLMSILSGAVNYNELYWLNGLIPLASLFFIYKTMPTEEDLLQQARELSR